MGCGSSMDTQTNHVVTEVSSEMQPRQNDASGNVVEQYVRLDEQISKLEGTCPGPRMATAEAWVEHIQSKHEAMLGLEGMGVAPFREREWETEEALPLPAYTMGRQGDPIVVNTPTKDLAQLAYNLGVIGDARKASMHEDFFANLSESALYLLSIRYYGELLEHTKVRVKTLVESYAELNELYVRQDGIIAYISGGTYMTRLEESIDEQLETARDTRDKLGSALEQWRICGLLLRAAANSSTQALKQWRQLGRIIDPKQKLQWALDCRSLLHASTISLEAAQLALPHVELKYMSHRQVLAVKHCNTYLITDIANKARYEHTSRVFTSYESNMSKTCTWLYETFNSTLRPDYDKAEETVCRLAKTLRDHREEVFSTVRK
ncbi:uncharacterized protein LOC6527624 isoform X2 [Drosophila yakuba]|uniref:Uncharacterized protein, isoform A n=1 Tax=Drosophila yakuba TaxID=7245 RepID=B4NWA7_DROYA|nr:uncharacterized protein LOC6527624 isoform X2 [Drosophila yakuba]EDW88424.1 uncharacterized protein Dyak_GE11263, isoform A [Drosophila yakuba]